jgi:rhodanese-related sulfurtransferase
MLEGNPRAQLVDVRTLAEWAYVGLPDLSALKREALCVEWQSFPQMTQNPQFVAAASEKVRKAGAEAQTPLLFLCRSGARSRAAAIAMTRAGFPNSYNIADGFEGHLDEAHHRGKRSGWKATGLPWRQS